jgi:hypothetical protein
MDGRVHFGLPYWRVGQHGERVASIAAPLFSGRCDLYDAVKVSDVETKLQGRGRDDRAIGFRRKGRFRLTSTDRDA